MPGITVIEPGSGRTVLVVVAHADDVALFLGGTVAHWAEAGWRVVVVRVTDDRWDSLGLDERSTVEANQREFAHAADILGVSEIVEFGMHTDVLGDASEVELRQRVIREIRRHRPYSLVTFDPHAAYGEDNQDHIRLAAAVDEAFWTAQFDKHHPEHFDEGLEPHGCFERWYFGRSVQRVTDVVDITSTLEHKLLASCTHRTMLTNFLNQLRLQARTGGWRVDAIDEALATGNVEPLMRRLLIAAATSVGDRHGLGAAEEFRVVRFGGLQPLLDAMGRRF